jgi:hypothetical protein
MSEATAGFLLGLILMPFVILFLAGAIISLGVVFGIPVKITFAILQKVVDKQHEKQ